jgi:hypothetical protein
VVKDIGGLLGNDVEVTAPDGVTKYIYNANMKKDDAEAAVDDLQQFIQLNNVTSTAAPAAVKPAVQSTMKPGRDR